jgi:hypothetical protein
MKKLLFDLLLSIGISDIMKQLSKRIVITRVFNLFPVRFKLQEATIAHATANPKEKTALFRTSQT